LKPFDGGMMDITIGNNRIYVKNVSLGQHFPGVVGDLIVDTKGRVNVTTPASFYTDLDCIDQSILQNVSAKLENEANNRTLMKLKKKIDRSIDRSRSNL
jgi:hypothetical protein